MRDAYDKLFVFIDRAEFFQNSIEDIIYIEQSISENLWSTLKYDVLNNNPVYIRGYGRDAKKTKYFIEFYKVLFDNNYVLKDANNNAQPTKLLKEYTDYCKVSKDGKNGKIKILNYQISHLFGKTKNPLLFNAPWNMAYIPKYLDPFTGHETQGKHSNEFKKLISSVLKDKLSYFIDDYNKIIDEFVSSRLEDALDQTRRNLRLTKKEFKRFEADCRLELQKI